MRDRLSKTEYDIMKYIWDSGRKCVTPGEIRNYFVNECGRQWKKQTVTSYLRELQEIGYLVQNLSGNRYSYTPTLTKAEYHLLPARDILAEQYNGSYSAFLAALAEPENISKEDIQEIAEILDRWKKYND